MTSGGLSAALHQVVGGTFVHANTRALLAALGFVLVVSSPGLARAQESTAENAGLGAASALSTLIYGPVKCVYALGGLIVGGLAWPLSGGDSDVMWKIMTPAVRGDYVVTPAHLTGERPLEFLGRDPAYGGEPAYTGDGA
jgi:hypothetical protein